MEPAPLYGTRKNRSLSLAEADKILIQERAVTSLNSWMSDYLKTIVKKINDNKLSLDLYQKVQIKLNGRLFEIKALSARFPGEYHISPVDDFVPCATFSLERIERHSSDGTSY